MGAVETTIREQASGQASQPSEETSRTEKVRFVVPEAKESDVDTTDGQTAEESTPNSLSASKINQEISPHSNKDSTDLTLTTTATGESKKDSASPPASILSPPTTVSATSPATSKATPAATSAATSAASAATSAATSEKPVPAAAAVVTKASLVDRFLSRSPKPEVKKREETKPSKPTASSTSSKPMSKARNNIWQNVVDGSLLSTKLFTHAAVYDQLTGEQLASSSKEFAVTKEEAVHLAKATHQPGRLAATGITVANEVFNYSHGELGTALYGSDPMNKHRGIVIEAGDVYMIVAIFEENGEMAKKNLKEMISHFKEHYSF